MSSIIPTISAAGLGVIVLQPFPDVTPFTIREGATYESILSGIRVWIRDELVPYLQDNSAQAIFQSNVDTMIDIVNGALGDQAATVTAALNAAVQEVVTADIPITAALFRTMGFIVAPVPSGGDDTAVLKALIDEAQATTGTVYLHPGVYLCNLDLNADFKQATVIGAGKSVTILRSFTPGLVPVIKFNGGSGAISHGGLRSMTVDGVDRARQAMGVALSGCGGVTIGDDVEILNCDSGVVFWNERGQDFTEFCTFGGSIYNCNRGVLYKADNGIESFHGSGLVGNAVVGLPNTSTGPAIQTQGIALPYNAPLSVTVFLSNAAQYLIDYGQTTSGRHASFHGDVRLEAGGLPVGAPLGKGNSARVYLNGTISYLASGQATLGNIFLADKITYDNSAILAQLKPVSSRAALKNTPTQVFVGVLQGGETALVTVHILGGNYDKSYLLLVYQSPYDGGGTVTVLGTTSNIDNNTPAKGDPVFSYSGSGLYIANPSFTSAQTAFARVTLLGGNDASLNLLQAIS